MTPFTPIEKSALYSPNKLPALGHDDTKEIEELLIGRKVVEVSEDQLLLDNGTVLWVIPNEGGCACASGDYYLSTLNKVDNIITRVEFDYRPTGDFPDSDYAEDEVGFYRIFVYAEHEKINLLQVDGDDGHGWYGTGFEIIVRTKEDMP